MNGDRLALVHIGCGGEVTGMSCRGCGADFLGAEDVGPSGRDYRATERLTPGQGNQEGDPVDEAGGRARRA